MTPRLRGRRSWSLAVRLMVAQGLVLVAGILTAALVAQIVGPPLFHYHLLAAGQTVTSGELVHIERAYASATTLTLLAALFIAAVAAVGVTWYVTTRLTAPLTVLAEAAGRLSQGDYDVRIPTLDAGPEFDVLATSLNDAAHRLQTTEVTRRRLLADLAHELRTPLATTTAYLDALDDGVATWDADTSRVLRASTTRLSRLADDMAMVSRAEEHRIELHRGPLDPAELLDAAAASARPGYADKGVRLIVEPVRSAGRRPARPRLEADQERLEQVLGNLLTNALRHTPAGGTVTLAAREDDGVVRITVTDTGEGIPPGQLPHVFERFYRGDAARTRDSGGSGIGLTIARGIATAHGGTLIAHSDGPGMGAVFELTLPLGAVGQGH
ncbi:MAG: ATP-binding protein [Propionibacterium sp.]|nr:ATP-binding protein [Propionibacterium sp.]